MIWCQCASSRCASFFGIALFDFFQHTPLLGLIALIATARPVGVDLNEPPNWNYRDVPYHFLMVHAWGTTDIAGWNAPSWSISAERQVQAQSVVVKKGL
jgi:hypothetical protein